jgi:hypothetical protein
MAETRRVFDVTLTHQLGDRTMTRNVRLLAEDEDDARTAVRHYRKNYETVGDVRAYGTKAIDDETAGTPDHNRRV